jgi:hypothetical protein
MIYFKRGKTMTKNILAGFIALGLAATAQAREVLTTDLAKYQAITPDQMDAAKIYRTYTTQPGTFDEWMNSAPAEVDHLALWKGYEEPKIRLSTSDKRPTKKLTVFVSRTKAVVNKPASSFNFATFIDLNFISSLNPNLIHKEVAANRILPKIAGLGPVSSFNWCNEAAQALPEDQRPPVEPFTRALREGVLDYTNPPKEAREPWCSNKERSKCIESCFIFEHGWQQGVMFANNTMVSPDDQKDLGVATQSEIQYFLSEEEWARSTPVSELTGVNGKVAGILRQNIFYVNQAFQFATVTAFFQEFPGDPNRTVVTSYVVFTIGTDTWNGYKGILKDVLMGRAKQFNTPTGITAGLPEFTEATSISITDILDK